MGAMILTMQTINFQTMKRNGSVIKGISDGGLYALSKHNERTEINETYDNNFKSKKKNVGIDEDKSKDNVYYKKLSPVDIKTLEDTEHRANSVGAFEMVFDLQDYGMEKFKKNPKTEKGMKQRIEAFLEQEGITERFDIIEMSLHLDEENPHYHIVFSGRDKLTDRWGYNDFFNPVIGQYQVKNSEGEPQFQKHNRGKNRGKYKYKPNSIEKIPKMADVRENGTQKLQDNWGDFIRKSTNNKITHDKEFNSLLQFNNYIYSKFTKEQRAKLSEIREIERSYYQMSISNPKKQERRDKVIKMITTFYDSSLDINAKSQSMTPIQKK